MMTVNLDKIRAKFLIPRLDNDGTKLNTAIAILEADLCNVFGGFTKQAANGEWKGASGSRYVDDLLCYWVVIESEQVVTLKDLLHDFKSRTRQHLIWVELSAVDLQSV